MNCVQNLTWPTAFLYRAVLIMKTFVIFTLDLILTLLPGQFQEVQSLDKLSDHDIVAGTLKVFIPPKEEISA